MIYKTDINYTQNEQTSKTNTNITENDRLNDHHLGEKDFTYRSIHPSEKKDICINNLSQNDTKNQDLVFAFNVKPETLKCGEEINPSSNKIYINPTNTLPNPNDSHRINSQNNENLPNNNESQITNISEQNFKTILILQVDSTKAISPRSISGRKNDNISNENDSDNDLNNYEEKLNNEELEVYQMHATKAWRYPKEFYEVNENSLQRQPFMPALIKLKNNALLSLKIVVFCNHSEKFEGIQLLISENGQLERSQRNTILEDAIVIGNQSAIKCAEGKYLIPNDVVIGNPNDETIVSHVAFLDVSNLYTYGGKCKFQNGSTVPLKIMRFNGGKMINIEGKSKIDYCLGDKIYIATGSNITFKIFIDYDFNI